jgi:O-antigen/teichoic acid export membrane protein
VSPVPSFRGALAALPIFFGIKVLSGLALLKISALFLPAGGFGTFSQFLLFGALINMVAIGGAQNGLVRQAAAAGDPHDLARAKGGAFLIWAVALSVIGLSMLVLREYVAELLVGEPGLGWAVLWIVAITLLTGPSQIFCSILSGRGRAPTSLGIQGLGLVIGTIAAIIVLSRREPVGAAIAFYLGPLLTVPISWAALRRHDIAVLPLRELMSGARVLLGFSGAFVAVAAFSSLVMFGLRYVYLTAFGIDALGYWMVAQRVSDTSTQLLGLFTVQLFLPAYTRAAGSDEGRSTILKSWLIATATLGGFLVCFAIMPAPLVRLFLSAHYLPAIGMILAYMTGDMLRVCASLAMQTAFARGRLVRYMAIEIGSVSLFAVITIGLTFAGYTAAPMVGYVTAYAVAAAIIAGGFFGLLSRGRLSRI